MKLILTLLKNEYIKLFKRKSVPILLLILLLFVFGISLIKPFEYYGSGDYYQKGLSYYKQRKQEYLAISLNPEYYLPSYDGKETQVDETVKAVIREFYEKQIALCDKAIAIENNDPNDWRLPVIVELLNLQPVDYLYDYVSGNNKYTDKVNEYLKGLANYVAEKSFSYSAQLKAIETNDYSESKRYLYNKEIMNVENYKANLDVLKKQRDNGTGGSDIDFRIEKAGGILRNSERITRAYKAALDKKIEYNSVQDKTLSYTVNAFQNAMFNYSSLLSKEEYEKNDKTVNFYSTKAYDVVYGSYNTDYTYEEYLDNFKKMREQDENKGLIGLYALENDVTEMSVANSSRFKSLSYVNLFWLIAPLAIFFASGMVSKEFSSKTINLLLIRPVKRWKILLSKYICLISLTFGIVVVCGLVYLFGTGVSYGFSDFSQPYIYISSGAATSTGFIGWFLWKVLLASIPIFCLVNLTFLFSTVTKGTAVSLILGVLSLFSSILILFFTGLIKNPDVLTYMPFPYFSMWSYMFDNVTVLDGSSINIFGEIIKTNLTYGVILLVGLIISSVIWAFADFTKKDIK